MLLEFSVSNFRSIKERQTLSLVASKRERDLPQNTVPLNSPGLSSLKTLKSAVLYGANASGKSTLLKAAQFMKEFVENSASRLRDGEDTGVVPFRLDPASRAQPTEFEVLYVSGGVRYQYGFILDARRVHEEWLTAYPQGRPQRWFSRSYDPKQNRYKFEYSTHFTGNKQAISELTRENALYLSTGSQYNHEALRSICGWFRAQLHVMDCSQPYPHESLGVRDALLPSDAADLERISYLLRQADLGVDFLTAGAAPKEKPAPSRSRETDSRQYYMPTFGLASLAVREEPAPFGEQRRTLGWHHRGLGGDETHAFASNDESSGTVKFLNLLVPWLEALDRGGTMFVDEIGAFLHPLLVRNLVKMIHSEETNPKGTQLVFTTHDATLMNTTLFRRDQVWLMERDRTGAASLYPLSDFKPRKGEALQKGYLAGRYGGVPLLGGGFAC